MELSEQVTETPLPHKYYGKYRGTVVNNVDPMQIGRIQAIVPDVSGPVPTSWAMPCLPGAGINTGAGANSRIAIGTSERTRGRPFGRSEERGGRTRPFTRNTRSSRTCTGSRSPSF